MIEPGQIYAACDPRDIDRDGNRRRIVIVKHEPGLSRAQIETIHTDGSRLRRRGMLVTYLHDSAITRTGQPRLRGYALVEEEARADG